MAEWRGKLECSEEFLDDSSERYWKTKNPANGSYEQTMQCLEEMKKLFDFIFRKKKSKKIDYEEFEQYYNVYVYQELPYPPGTKNRKWFEID